MVHGPADQEPTQPVATLPRPRAPAVGPPASGTPHPASAEPRPLPEPALPGDDVPVGTREGPPPAGPAPDGPVRNWPTALAIVIIGMFMSVLDISIVNVAVPTIQREFGTDDVDIQWITTAYSLALGVIVPVSGWLGERFGLARVYALSVVGFGFASALCGLAWDLESLVVFRILQAVPGGILPVITLTMLYRVVPREKIGIGMAAYGLSAVFAPATGPTLGGWLVEVDSWRWIFFINVPVGLVAAVLAFALLPKLPRTSTGRFDTWGFVTVAGGLFALLLALSKGPDWGWTGYRVLMLLTTSMLLLATFVIVELEVERPLLDVRLFRLWSFTNSQLLIAVLSGGFFAVLFYVPYFLQEGQGKGPLHTGLVMLPEALAMGVTLPISGWLYDKVGPRWPAAVGVALCALGTGLLCGMTADLSDHDVMLWTSLRGVGNALAMVPIMTAGLSLVPADRMDAASAINNVVQRVSGALSLAVLTSMATAQYAQAMADRAVLMPEPMVDDRVLAMQREGPRAWLPYLEQLQVAVQAQVYADLFLVVAGATALATLTALTFSGRRPTADDTGQKPIEAAV